MFTIRVQKLPHCPSLPRYETIGAAGMDIRAAVDKPKKIHPGERFGVPTGLIFEIPGGYEGQLRARSGLALKAGLTLVNGVGTIDSDYRGEVFVLIINHGQQPYTIEPGERIAQLVVMPIPKITLEQVEEIEKNQERGESGFGSTGKVD
ncbi:MAG: dUTP diphosphatase [Cyanobacteriota/Melainabacteria group bacterium]